ncbi:hypothetical protein AgCh_012625 [Apium graveolens]
MHFTVIDFSLLWLVHIMELVACIAQLAILGGTIQVPTLIGDVVLKVRPRTRPGQKFVLKKKGSILKPRMNNNVKAQMVLCHRMDQNKEFFLIWRLVCALQCHHPDEFDPEAA